MTDIIDNLTDIAPRSLPTERTCPFDPPADLAKIREEEPVSQLTYPNGSVGWLVTGHSAARSVLGDPRFSSRGELIRMPVPHHSEPAPAQPGAFILMDPPEQTRYRKPLAREFTLRRVRAMEPRIEELTRKCIDDMRRNGPSADVMRDFSMPLTSMVICELLGVPYEDHEFFQKNIAALVDMNKTDEELKAATGALVMFMAKLVQAKREKPTGDMLSGLVEAGELNDVEMAGMAMLLLLGGYESTAANLALAVFSLLEKPDQLAMLRSDPSLIDNAVEELLRYLTVVQIGLIRAALEDVEVEGKLIKAGDVVTVSIAAANRDPVRFPCPDMLDLTQSANGHLAFGHGVHQCVGQQLGRVEMRIALTMFLREFPDLRLAIPAEDVKMREDMGIYGAHSLPVTLW